MYEYFTPPPTKFHGISLWIATLILGTLMTTSCSKDRTTFTAITQDYNSAKDYITGTIVHWHNGDAVQINGQAYNIAIDANQNNKATIDAEGASDIGGEYYAAYPADIAAINGGQISFSIPQEETYATNGGQQVVHSIMAAKADGNTLRFQNLCALLHFKVNASGNGIGAKLHAIEVVSDKPLYGTIVAQSAESQWQVQPPTGTDATSRTLHFSTPLDLAAETKDLYLLVPPVSGASTFTLRLTIEDNNGIIKVFEKTKAANIAFSSGELCHFDDVNTFTGSAMKFGDTEPTKPVTNGSVTHPYIVNSATNWAALADTLKKAGKHITLAADINVGSTLNGELKAVLDGNGHTITLTTQGISLFSTVNGGTVKNLTIAAASDVTSPVLVDNGNKCYGSLAGVAKGNAVFDNCTNRVNIICDVELSGLKIGGLIGLANKCSITNCTNYGNITSNFHNIGGIVGEMVNMNSISGCTNYGNITTTSSSETVKTQNCGGISSRLSLTDSSLYCTDCHNYGNIILQKASASDSYIGGIFGQASCCISHCSNSGTIACNNTGNKAKIIGGIVGIFNPTQIRTMHNCSSIGDITATNGSTYIYAGGLIGKNNRTNIKNCYAKCNVEGNNIAGIVADGSGLSANITISNCYFYGELSATAANAYGIAGVSNSTYKFTIDHCYYPTSYSLCHTPSPDNDYNATLSSGTTISGGSETSLRDALNANINNMPTGSYTWKNSDDNTFVVFNIPNAKK